MAGSPLQCLLKIKALYPELSGNYRKIADFICGHPQDIVGSRVRELAAKCGCDDAQIIRFCQKIGYRGIHELRAALVSELIPITRTAPGAMSEGASFPQWRKDFLSTNNQVLQDTVALFREEDFATAVDWICQAGKIVLCGVGTSGLVAQDMTYKLVRMGFRAAFAQDPELNQINCALLDRRDCLVAISYSGENDHVCRAVEAVKRTSGAKIIAVTNVASSRLGGMADLCLRTASGESSFRIGAMTSRIAQFVVVDFLTLQLMLRRPEAAESSILRTQQFHQQ